MNWNILVTSGKEIKRDSMSSGNESREADTNIQKKNLAIQTLFMYIRFNK